MFPIVDLPATNFPRLLREIPQPPETLNYRGNLPSPEMKLLSIVGSRKYTTYGKEAVDTLVSGLAGFNIGVVSGLALGIDSLAHEAALEHDLYTLAIPGGGLNDEVIYPATHKRLAHRILDAGGGLLSEFDYDFKATKWSFPQRNRLVAGISHATLLIEAAEKSGTLITARMATDYNRELLVVPGSIFSKNSQGTHQFLKLGATPVTSSEDILHALQTNPEIKSLNNQKARPKLSEQENKIIKFLHEPCARDELVRNMNLPANEVNVLLMQMEIAGHITETNGLFREQLS